mmetsp:Transcript_13392/g.30300  ORF Transcript_13392/g.30300 Transcript_13392/m.30300 type:complete len:127 (+) Transcript_13392:304-684(+)
MPEARDTWLALEHRRVTGNPWRKLCVAKSTWPAPGRHSACCHTLNKDSAHVCTIDDSPVLEYKKDGITYSPSRQGCEARHRRQEETRSLELSNGSDRASKERKEQQEVKYRGAEGNLAMSSPQVDK